MKRGESYQSLLLCRHSKAEMGEVQYMHEIKVGMVRLGSYSSYNSFLALKVGKEIIDDESTIDELLDNPLVAIDRLVERFGVPLEAANADFNEICHEFELILSYSGQYNFRLSISFVVAFP